MPTSRSTLLLLAMLCLAAAGCGGGDPNFARGFDKDLMELAVAKARATQGQFVAALGEKKAGRTGVAVKKGFPAGDQQKLHLWLSDVQWDGKVFTGTVDNPPREVTEVKAGDRALVKPDELSDWMFIEAGELHGGYTLRALHFQGSPSDQTERQKRLPFTIPPIDF